MRVSAADRPLADVRPRPVLSPPALAGTLVVLAAAGLLGVSVGPADLGPADLVRALPAVAGREVADPVAATILLSVRLPRVAAAMLVGAALAASGAVFQGLLRNPLADPHVVGVSAGAALGAVAAIAAGATGRWLGFPAVSVFAFAGGLAAILAVERISAAAPGARALGTVLAGVVLSTFCSAIVMLLITASPDAFVRGSLVWLMGDLGMVAAGGLPALGVAVALGVTAVYASSRSLNLLACGEETAHTLGVNVSRARLGLFVLGSLLTGVAVAAVGIVGFVGLVVPHAVRLVAGADHRALVPLAAVLGAAFLVLADLVARVVAAPAELPIGAVTALCGAPFFLWLLVRRPPGTER